ncbi:DUF2062 domain-containing protein [Galenea microaerophila]
MPRKLLKKYSPDPDKIRNMKGLGFLGKWLGNPALWHFHRHSVARAFVIGLFWMAIPMPSQMVAAALTAIIFRANLPISVALVWISNPLTMPPIFYFNYLVGTWILHTPAQQDLHFELSWHWMMTTLDHIWLPLYLGSAVVGIVLGVIFYFLVQCYWRWHVAHRWKQRHQTV